MIYLLKITLALCCLIAQHKRALNLDAFLAPSLPHKRHLAFEQIVLKHAAFVLILAVQNPKQSSFAEFLGKKKCENTGYHVKISTLFTLVCLEVTTVGEHCRSHGVEAIHWLSIFNWFLTPRKHSPIDEEGLELRQCGV